MQGLDIHSLVTFVLFGFFMWITIFIIHIVIYRGNEENLKSYVFGKSLQFIVCLLYYLYPDRIDNSLIVITTPLLYIGCAIEIYMYYLYSGKETKRAKKQIIWLTAISILAFILSSQNVTIRVVVTSLYFVLLYSFLIYGYTLNQNSTQIQKTMGWIAVIFVVANAARGIFTLIQGVELPVFSDEVVQIYTGLVWAAVAICSPLIFLFVIKEKDNINLTELNATKSKFFRIIGHDLKGPIGQFIAFFDLIENNYDKLSDKELRKYLKAMKDSSERSYKLLENLLDWARSQTGAIRFKPSQLNIRELIEENTNLLHRQSEVKNIRINTSNIKDGTFTGDRNMVNTIIRNLVSNAIKFTHEGGEVTISNEFHEGNVTISVEDNGIGIRESYLPKLFKIDGGLNTEGTNNEQGTGLGLILCKEFIDQHHGEIKAISTAGLGSLFQFSIPLQAAS
ncbi:MAG: hypothetical protein CMB99_06165 [Flavobacteriaceae bacterium]|nr:hypothetical protein [Flavobacteriaceae bacterium]